MGVIKLFISSTTLCKSNSVNNKNLYRRENYIVHYERNEIESNQNVYCMIRWWWRMHLNRSISNFSKLIGSRLISIPILFIQILISLNCPAMCKIMVIIEQSIPVSPATPPMHTKIWQKKTISYMGDAEMSVPYLIVMLECHSCIFLFFSWSMVQEKCK